MLLTLVLGAAAALGAFLVGMTLASRQPRADVIAAAGGGARRLGAPAPNARDRIEGRLQQLAERRGRRNKKTLPEELAQAGLTLRTSEWLGIRVGCALVLALLGLARFEALPQAVIFGIIGYFAPTGYLRYRQSRRRGAFARQLVDAVTLLSSALKAGHSFPQGLDLVAKNAPAPLSEEFDRVVREMSIGGSPEQALQKMVRRVESDDLDLVVTAVLIHQSIGGNLARILDSISHTLRERIRVRGEISAITAQARASGWIITALPIAVAGLLYVIAPGYFRPMTQQVLGWVMLALCAFAIFVGNLFIRRITRIRV